MTEDGVRDARHVGPASMLPTHHHDWREAYERDVRNTMLARVRLVGLLHVFAHVLGFLVFDLRDQALPVMLARVGTLALLGVVIGLSCWRQAARCGFALSLGVCLISTLFITFDALYWGMTWMQAADVTLVLLSAAIGFPYSLRQMLALQGVVMGIVLAAVVVASNAASLTGLAQYSFHTGLLLALIAVSTYAVARQREREHHATYALAREQERGEQLLLNILPTSIASRLKREHASIVDGFSDATVLFADIVGFTPMSEQVSPAALVQLLNDVFSRFDELTDEHGLEKIKTIGDAYMVAGGLPEPREDHAEAVADMALGMREAVRGVTGPDGQPLRIRVGINSGPVVAGVIGTKKFIYDLWGDAVNTAARMETHAEPGTIQVTAATWERLKDRYAFEARGAIRIKGKGEMETYCLLGRQPAAATPAVRRQK